MAVWAKVDSGQPVKNGGAVVQAPERNSTAGIKTDGSYEVIDPAGAYHTLLNTRFDAGGSTGWERPGSNLT